MKNNQLLTILAVDTSCDETSVAVVRGQRVLSNIISSQIDLHKQYGGVFPTVAKQAHKDNIEPTIVAALKKADVTDENIDYLAVTQGPGLAPALEIGIQKTLALGRQWDKPVVLVNHIEGHVVSVLNQANPKTREFKIIEPKFPVLSIVVSGGHTEFILVEQIGKYKKLGFTVDDAAGECLDKVGRLLGLGYPAGPVVEQLAKKGNPKAFPFPLPMTASKDYNMSFSGLKTHSRKAIAKLEEKNKLNKNSIADFCASLQRGVFRHITYKLNKLLANHPVKELWLGGGVVANQNLRKEFRKVAKEFNLKLRVPYSKKICGDNAAMIGTVAYYKIITGNVSPAINLDRIPNWSIENV